MAKKVIKLSIQSIIDDLNDGIAWYASEQENGETSIETKYEISKEDVDDIRLHPALKDQEPASFTVIELIDDRRDVVSQNKPKGEIKQPKAKIQPENKLVDLIDHNNVDGPEQQLAPAPKEQIGISALNQADFDLNFEPNSNTTQYPNFAEEL